MDAVGSPPEYQTYLVGYVAEVSPLEHVTAIYADVRPGLTIWTIYAANLFDVLDDLSRAQVSVLQRFPRMFADFRALPIEQSHLLDSLSLSLVYARH